MKNIKLKTTAFALSLLFSFPINLNATHALQSDILKTVDGMFMDGPTIALVKRYQLDSKSILFGKRQKDGTREGTYIFNGTNYSAVQLCELEEQNIISKKETERLLGEMKDDFEKISAPFQTIVRSVKPIMVELIFESCRLRKRNDSLIIRWAAPNAKDERELLNEHVKTINDFEAFIVDLHNFLDDLLKSCPKGMKLYEEWKAEQLAKARNRANS